MRSLDLSFRPIPNRLKTLNIDVCIYTGPTTQPLIAKRDFIREQRDALSSGFNGIAEYTLSTTVLSKARDRLQAKLFRTLLKSSLALFYCSLHSRLCVFGVERYVLNLENGCRPKVDKDCVKI